MANFFRKMAKEVGQLADKASIPMLKDERNEMEAERTMLEKEVAEARNFQVTMQPVVSALEASVIAQRAALSELQVVLARRGQVPSKVVMAPIASAVEVSSGSRKVENAEARMPSMKEVNAQKLNDLFFLLSETQERLAEQLRDLIVPDDVAGKEEKIAELTQEIDKINAKLKKIRGN